MAEAKALDTDIQEAILKLDKWEGDSIDILKEFQEYKGMVSVNMVISWKNHFQLMIFTSLEVCCC